MLCNPCHQLTWHATPAFMLYLIWYERHTVCVDTCHPAVRFQLQWNTAENILCIFFLTRIKVSVSIFFFNLTLNMGLEFPVLVVWRKQINWMWLPWYMHTPKLTLSVVRDTSVFTLCFKWGRISSYAECNLGVFGLVHTCIYVQLSSCDQITEKALSGWAQTALCKRRDPAYKSLQGVSMWSHTARPYMGWSFMGRKKD